MRQQQVNWKHQFEQKTKKKKITRRRRRRKSTDREISTRSRCLTFSKGNTRILRFKRRRRRCFNRWNSLKKFLIVVAIRQAANSCSCSLSSVMSVKMRQSRCYGVSLLRIHWQWCHKWHFLYKKPSYNKSKKKWMIFS